MQKPADALQKRLPVLLIVKCGVPGSGKLFPRTFGASSSRPIAYGNRVPPSDHPPGKLSAPRSKSLPLQNAAIGRDGDHLPRDELAAVLQGRDRRVLQTAAAGHFHAQDRDAPDVVVFEDLGQLLAVVHGIQLGTADEGDLAPHELLVEVCIGVGGAVGGDEQLGPVEVGCVHRHQLDLAGPLTQLGCRDLRGHRCRGGFPVELAHRTARTTVECRLLGGSGGFLLLVFQHGLLIVGGSFPLGEGDGPGGTAGQAVAEAVAVVVPHQPGLAVHQANGPFVAGGDAGPAAVAFFFVYVNDFSDHENILLVLMA